MLKPINLPDSFQLQCSTCDDGKSFVVTALCGGTFGCVSCLPVTNSAAHYLCTGQICLHTDVSLPKAGVWGPVGGTEVKASGLELRVPLVVIPPR